MTDAAQDIEITAAGPANLIRFNRPHKKNAVTRAMYDAISDALASGEASSSVRVHVFLGSNDMFTAGNDLNDFLAASPSRPETLAPVLRFLKMLPEVTKPMLAAVPGPAIGIGATLLFHCDLVYATPNASISAPFLDLGLVPENASSLLAPQRLGYARAFELLVLGEPMTAELAREAGLVNRVVDAAELEATALTAAKRLAAKPPEALAISRRLLRGDPKDVAARSLEEASAFLARLGSPEAREAISAVLEKRPPNFSGLAAGGQK